MIASNEAAHAEDSTMTEQEFATAREKLHQEYNNGYRRPLEYLAKLDALWEQHVTTIVIDAEDMELDELLEDEPMIDVTHEPEDTTKWPVPPTGAWQAAAYPEE